MSNTEIVEFCDAVTKKEDVSWFHIAVSDSFGVEIAETLADLFENGGDRTHVKAPGDEALQ